MFNIARKGSLTMLISLNIGSLFAISSNFGFPLEISNMIVIHVKDAPLFVGYLINCTLYTNYYII